MESDELPTSSEGTRWETVERIFKFGTGAIAIVYIFGFLVVSTAHARYGIVLFDLFRARVLAAGLLITLLVLIPVVTGLRVYDKWLELRTKQPIGFPGYLVVGIFMIWIWGIVTCEFYPLFPGNSRTVFHVSSNLAWWILTCFSALPLVISFPKRYPFVTLMMLLLTVGILNFCVFVMFSKSLFILAAWLIVFTAAPVSLIQFITREKVEGRKSEWYFKSAGYCIVAVIAFTHTLYFRIKPGWGGGLPQRVTVNLTKSIPLSNPGNIRAFLIDETDKGYYLTINPDDHKASFVPRDAVGSIDFEEVK